MTYRALVCLVVLAAASSASAQQNGVVRQHPVITATRATDAIRVDGVLDEASWRDAASIGPLTQREPNEGVPATEATDVRIAFTSDALYLGIVCHDRDPQAVVATKLTRDAELEESDDNILVILDPFFDHRNGFFFQVNPVGARTDGQVSNNAEHLTSDWDGIWDASARRTPEGWTVEIEIPFKTLRFDPDTPAWGLNVERYIARRNENDRWASPRRDVWISNLAEAGRLEGLRGVRQGRGLDLRPYLSAGDRDENGKMDVGLDVFKNLTPNLNASLTINTDFAETEVDTRQVNLTRFPLFFPEKRAFFLEGAGVFDVAGLGSSNVDLIPFFTRRVGLLEGREVPIAAGAKLIGRQGNYNIGVLDVQTRDLPDAPQTGQNLLAARVSRNLFRQSWIGAIVTHGNPEGTGQNTTVGADARFATSEFRGSKNLSLDVYLLRSSDEASRRADYAGGFKIDYPNDLWDVALNWKQIGDDFQPALGFVPRRGIRKTSVGVEFMPRPHGIGVRQFFFEFRPEYVTNLQNRVQNWRIFTAPLNLQTESAEHLEWNYIPEYEHLDAPFPIFEGIVISPGSYQWNRFRAEVNTATRRRWVADAAIWWGGFYEGTRREVELGFTLKPSAHVLLATTFDHNDVRLPQGAFTTRIWSVRGDYNISPNVSWANIVQYDSESRLLGAQSRFRWILKPGNDLFLVFNRGWLEHEDGRYTPAFDRASAKVQYTFRF